MEQNPVSSGSAKNKKICIIHKHIVIHMMWEKTGNEYVFYLAGVRSRDEEFQCLSFQLRQPSIAVLTPYPSFTTRRTSTARGRRSRPKTRGATKRTRWSCSNPWWDGPWRARERSRWRDSWAWWWGACGAGHGAGTLWCRTCAGACGFLIGLSAPCVREKWGRLGRRSVRHLF